MESSISGRFKDRLLLVEKGIEKFERNSQIFYKTNVLNFTF
jgi:hypothetical protein